MQLLHLVLKYMCNCFERFLYDIKMVTREHEQGNNLIGMEQLDCFSERK